MPRARECGVHLSDPESLVGVATTWFPSPRRGASCSVRFLSPPWGGPLPLLKAAFSTGGTDGDGGTGGSGAAAGPACGGALLPFHGSGLRGRAGIAERRALRWGRVPHRPLHRLSPEGEAPAPVDCLRVRPGMAPSEGQWPPEK